MQILWEMGMEDKDETVCDDVEAEIKEINEAIEQLELELLLSGKYDANNAIFDSTCRCWWNRSARLDTDVITHVWTLGRTQWL